MGEGERGWIRARRREGAKKMEGEKGKRGRGDES
jgi:hypothetical protein